MRLRSQRAWSRLSFPWLAGLALLLWVEPGRAIRPFVTDDARVVGGAYAQLETWLVLDPYVFEHNFFGAFGPTDWLELTVGGTQGTSLSGSPDGYSVAGPVLQLKALIFPALSNSWPGLAVATGVISPFGTGVFAPPDWGCFGYVALTESLLDEWILIHANLGVTVGEPTSTIPGGEPSRAVPTAGIGSQIRMIAGLHLTAEVYYGDPYDSNADFPALQAGVRYIFSEFVQMDGTFGSSLAPASVPSGDEASLQWGSLGLRLVTPELW